MKKRIADQDLLRELQKTLLVRRNKIRLHLNTIGNIDSLMDMISRELERLE